MPFADNSNWLIKRNDAKMLSPASPISPSKSFDRESEQRFSNHILRTEHGNRHHAHQLSAFA